MIKHSLKTRLLVFILLISIIPLAFIGYSGYSSTKKYIIEKEEEKINFFLDSIKGKTIKFFYNTKKDILFLKGITEENVLHFNYDISDVHKKELQNIYYHFSANNIQYDQIRFIDKEGYEVIRINNYKGKPYIVPEDKLQYKGDRYYYEKSLKLKKGEIYVSNIDLNQENGQIERPLKPVIRYATPVYANNNLRGFLVLNLNVQYLFDDIERAKLENKYENIILLDNDGNYLLHPDKEKEWGSLKNFNTGENIKKDYPEISNEIFSSKGLKIKKNGENILAWYSIEPECLNYKKIVMFMEIAKENYLNPLIDFRHLFLIQVIVTIIALIISGNIISLYITRPILEIVKAVESIGKGDFDVSLNIKTNDELQLLSYEIKKMTYELKNMYKNMEKMVGERTKELRIAHQELKELATKDSLTGLYNRHYFNQYIQNVADNIKNSNKNMMILIIDVDKFKYINDNYGHNIGDIVLKDVAQILNQTTRQNDFTVRYGGDEFLVALDNSTKEIAEKYIQRVKKSLDEWNIKNGILNHELTLSIGYDEYSGDKHILEVINRADKMMYENKIAKRKKQ